MLPFLIQNASTYKLFLLLVYVPFTPNKTRTFIIMCIILIQTIVLF